MLESYPILRQSWLEIALGWNVYYIVQIGIEPIYGLKTQFIDISPVKGIWNVEENKNKNKNRPLKEYFI